MSSDGKSIMEVCDLARTSADGKQLLFPTSFSVLPHDAIVCQGATGSGKTILLRCLALLDQCSGHLSWHGHTVTSAKVPDFRAQIVYLPQRPCLPESSVRSALQAPFAWKAHTAHSYDESRAVSYFESLGQSTNLIDSLTGDLSGGEAQLVAIVRAMLLDPSILLLDEPTAALDEVTKQKLEDVVMQWRAHRNRAVVWVTHDQRQADRVANRRFRVDSGSWSIDV